MKQVAYEDQLYFKKAIVTRLKPINMHSTSILTKTAYLEVILSIILPINTPDMA